MHKIKRSAIQIAGARKEVACSKGVSIPVSLYWTEDPIQSDLRASILRGFEQGEHQGQKNRDVAG